MKPLKDGESVDLLGGLQRLTAQQIPAGRVSDGQRIAVPVVREHEFALVVGAPEIVGMHGLGEHSALGSVASSATSADQTVPIQHCVHSADGRQTDPQIQSPELLANLRSTELRRGDVGDPVGSLLALTDQFGNRVDLLVGLCGLEDAVFTRVIEVAFEGEALRVVGAEDFIAMKVFAGGLQDIAMLTMPWRLRPARST